MILFFVFFTLFVYFENNGFKAESSNIPQMKVEA